MITAKLKEKPKLPHIVRINPSRIMLWSVFAAHMVAAFGLGATRLPVVITIGLLLFITISMWHFFREWQHLPVYRLQLFDHQWKLVDEGKTNRGTAQIITRCYYGSRYMVILQIENSDGQRRYLPVVFDACRQAEFHKLRLISRYEL